jgi:hypothetical protein
MTIFDAHYLMIKGEMKMDPKLARVSIKKDKLVKVIIECKEYKILNSMNDKLIEYNNAGEYEAYNDLIDYIEENYTPIGHMSNIYYRK